MKKRILMLLTVVVLMVVMLAMSVSPAFAQAPPLHARATACLASGGNAFGPWPFCLGF
jgi:hypothetical protein